jgi:hypothetical protein
MPIHRTSSAIKARACLGGTTDASERAPIEPRTNGGPATRDCGNVTTEKRP